MTCPTCRERGEQVPVDVVAVKHDNRSVEAKIEVTCPKCGWKGGPYAI